MARTAFDRWDVGGSGGVRGVLPPHYKDFGYWRDTPPLDGSLWAACFDLRWQFVAAHQQLILRADERHWGLLIPPSALHVEWLQRHKKKHVIAESRRKLLVGATGFAEHLLLHPEAMERTFKGTPLWEGLPLEVWESVLEGLVTGVDWATTDVRAWSLMWGFFRHGITWPKTTEGLVRGVEEVFGLWEGSVNVGTGVDGCEQKIHVGKEVEKLVKQSAFCKSLKTLNCVNYFSALLY